MAPHNKTDPGARGGVRGLAHDILLRVEEGGAFASILLDRAESRLADRRDAALLHELVLGVLRRQALLDHALAAAARRPTAELDAALRIALRVGAYQILFLDRVPDFAAVDSAVEWVKGSGRKRVAAAAGLTNAVLRRIASQGADALPRSGPGDDARALSVIHSHPEWWVERIVSRLGLARAAALLAADNQPAPTVLCVNPRRGTPEEIAARLAREGVLTQPCARPGALRVETGSLTASATLQAGDAWVQDEASQLVAGLFGERVGPRAVDLCAAPGSKTMQLAALLVDGGTIVACDRHLGRLRRLVRLAQRARAGAVLPVQADMTARPPVRGPFDQVLVDAPCSGTGTLRRHPEIRWRLRPEDFNLLAARQGRLLAAGAALTAVGGSLLYSVCSVEPEEGEDVVERFLLTHPEFRVVDPACGLPQAYRDWVDPRGFLRTWPDRGRMDGFFAAKMVRNA